MPLGFRSSRSSKVHTSPYDWDAMARHIAPREITSRTPNMDFLWSDPIASSDENLQCWF